MKKIAIAIIVFIIAALAFWMIFQMNTASPNPPSKNGFVEKAWNYCSAFTPADCNLNHYDTNEYPNPVNCFWNEKTSKCEAQIGYI